MESFATALWLVRQLSAQSGRTYRLFEVVTGFPAPRGIEWGRCPVARASVPDLVPPEEVSPDRFFVFPSGLILAECDLPWVWMVRTSLPEPTNHYLYGTANECFRFCEATSAVAAWSVPVEDLNGLLVQTPEGRTVLARPFPAYCRNEGQAPQHEEWAGVPVGTPVHPIVPSGFTEDFAFRY